MDITESDISHQTCIDDLPTHWDDGRLLDFEPLKTYFALRSCAEQETYSLRKPWKREDNFYNKIWEERGKMHQAYVEWTRLAFQKTSEADITKARDLTASDIMDGSGYPWRCFLDIFWILFAGERKDAQLCLNDHRRKRGFAQELIATEIRANQESTMKITSRPLIDTRLNYTREEYYKRVSLELISAAKLEKTLISNNDREPIKATKAVNVNECRRKSSRKSIKHSGSVAGQHDLTVKEALRSRMLLSSLKTRVRTVNGAIDTPPIASSDGEDQLFDIASQIKKDDVVIFADNSCWTKPKGRTDIQDTCEQSAREQIAPQQIDGEDGIASAKRLRKHNNFSSVPRSAPKRKCIERNDTPKELGVGDAKKLRIIKRNQVGSLHGEYEYSSQLTSSAQPTHEPTGPPIIEMKGVHPKHLDQHCGPSHAQISRYIPHPFSNAPVPSRQEQDAGVTTTLPRHCYFQPIGPKLPLPNKFRPRIWAASRQALCETAVWFRAFQSGVYASDGAAHGYLLGSYSSRRDQWCHDGKFIVSHGGGGSNICHDDAGVKVVIASDQNDYDRSVKALRNTFRRGSPLVLIIDDTYRLFPYDLGRYSYAVLGYYKIVNFWAEVENATNSTGQCVKYKFAFQWCENQDTPWWMPEPEPAAKNVSIGWQQEEPVEVQELDQGTRILQVDAPASCAYCRGPSPSVYSNRWACLNPRCGSFWQGLASSVPDVAYRSEFLSLRQLSEECLSKEDLRPYTQDQFEQSVKTLSGRYVRGWWCPQCGQLHSREKWEFWECPDCSQRYPDGGFRVVPKQPKEFWEENRELAFNGVPKSNKESGIQHIVSQWKTDVSSGPLNTFLLPYNRGRIYILSEARGKINQRADDIFLQYQSEAAKGGFLRRYPLRSHRCRGRLLANYFSQNSGVPYKYVAGTDNTVPFHEAPTVVRDALHLIKSRASIVCEKGTEFNEILTAAYMERQKMGYHTDSEEGLGPVVSSLSLGAPAWMHFRIRAKTQGKRQRELSIPLLHGDVLVMDGAEIQKIYEHTVDPMGFRIAATARVIGQSNYASCLYPQSRS